MEFIQQVGFLPLLDSGIPGFSAEDVVDEDCRYVVFDDGWDWPLLTTPELLLGRDASQCERTPQQSFERMASHFRTLLPDATDTQIAKLLH